MKSRIPLEQWPERLQRVLDRHGACVFKRITVLRETDSTQDAARRLDAKPGHVVTAWRQTAGRGRLGRQWVDTSDDGVAVTFVVQAEPPERTERLPIAAAVGVARAIERCGNGQVRVGIKWPNDIMLSGRKLAGILIEQSDGIALIGIGINVSQQTWPEEIAPRAVSLAQHGVAVDRLVVLQALLDELDAALRLDAALLAEEFAVRDVLRGSGATLRCGKQLHTGTIVQVDPFRGLALQTMTGLHWLPAATTTLLEWSAQDSIQPGVPHCR